MRRAVGVRAVPRWLARRPVTVRLTAAVVVLAMVVAGGWMYASRDGWTYRGPPVSVATGVPSGVYYGYGQLLAPRLSADLGTPVSLDATAGSVENLHRLLDGRDTFGLAAADAVADLALSDRTRLSAVARLYDDYAQLVVRVGSPVRSLQDLRGLRVSTGPAGSGVELVTSRLLAAAGMNADRDLRRSRSGLGEAVADLRAGRIDALFWSGGLPTKAISDLAGVRLVPLGALAATLRARYGPVYREAVVPADTYGTEVATVAVPNILVVAADADPGMVRRVTGTVMRSRGAIGSQVHAAQLVDPRTAIFTDPLPLHEGARRWYRSVKP